MEDRVGVCPGLAMPPHAVQLKSGKASSLKGFVFKTLCMFQSPMVNSLIYRYPELAVARGMKSVCFLC